MEYWILLLFMAICLFIVIPALWEEFKEEKPAQMEHLREELGMVEDPIQEEVE